MNFDQCQQYVIEPTFDVNDLTEIVEWIEPFLALCQQRCDWDMQAQTDNANHLKRHIGNNSIYVYKSELINNLKLIYARLTNQLSGDFPPLCATEQSKILIPLAGEMAGCTEGFYNRSISTVRHFTQPQSLPSLLMRVREKFIDQLARKLSSNVHMHTQIFTLANTLGFGTPVINTGDTLLAGNVAFNEKVTNMLLNRIDSQFRPFFIIKKLVSQIKTELLCHGYEGKKIEDTSNPLTYGYKAGHYDHFIIYLQSILDQEINYNYLILDDKNQVVDLDWFAVKSLMWSTLVARGYFHHPMKWIDDLLMDDVPSDNESMLLFPEIHDLIQFLICFSDLGPQKLTRIISDFIKQYLQKNPTNKSSMIRTILGAIALHDEPGIDALFYFMKDNYLSDMKAFIFYSAPDTLLIRNPKMSKLFLMLVDYLQLEEQKNIFRQCSLALAMALYRGHEDANSLLYEINKTSVENQFSILIAMQLNDNNVLMLAMLRRENYRALRTIMRILFSIHHHLGAECSFTFLAQVNIYGKNAMVLAVEQFVNINNDGSAFEVMPALDVPMVNLELNLNNNEQGNVFEAQNIEHPHTEEKSKPIIILDDLLTLIDSFSPERQAFLFKQQDFLNKNNLLMSVLKQPVLCLRLLGLLARFDRDDITTILQQTDVDNYNLIMLAIVDAPECFLSLLNLLKPQEEPIQTYRILSELSISPDIYENAIMLAASTRPQYLVPLLQCIDLLTADKKNALFQPEDIYGNNFLMSILQLEDKMLRHRVCKAFFHVIRTLTIYDIATLFVHSNDEDETALSIASEHYPTAIPELKQFILGRIVDNIIATALTCSNSAFHYARDNQLNALKIELLHLVNGDKPALLKDKFRQFSMMAVNASSSSLTFFHARSNASRDALFLALDYFGESICSTLTGGYINSAALLADLASQSEEEDMHVSKLRRIEKW